MDVEKLRERLDQDFVKEVLQHEIEIEGESNLPIASKARAVQFYLNKQRARDDRRTATK